MKALIWLLTSSVEYSFSNVVLQHCEWNTLCMCFSYFPSRCLVCSKKEHITHRHTMCSVLIWPSRREWLCRVRSLIQTHTQTHESIRALWVCLCVCVLSTQSSPPLATQLENMCICVVFMGLRVGRWVEFCVWYLAERVAYVSPLSHICMLRCEWAMLREYDNGAVPEGVFACG